MGARAVTTSTTQFSTMLKHPFSGTIIGAIIAVAAIAILSVTSATGDLLELTTWASYAILAFSLVLVWGKGEIFSFAQAAFFGVGAYAYGVVSLNLTALTGESITGLLGGALAAAFAAAVIGYFIFYGQLRPLPVAVVTLAFSLVLNAIFNTTSDSSFRIGDAILGGYNGMSVPALTVPGYPVGLDERSLFVVVALIAVATAVFIRILMRRPFGRILVATAGNEERSELLGYEPRSIKLRTFIIGGVIAGLGGALYAGTTLYIDPTIFGLAQAALVVVWVVVGGRSSLIGGLVGVLLVQKLNAELGSTGGNFTPIILGGVLILIVVALPGGLVPSLIKLIGKVTRASRPSVEPVRVSGRLPLELGTAESAELKVSHLSKKFGGLTANDDVNLVFPPRSINAIVGPNGAGKSTLFSLLVGIHRPTSGDIRYGALDMAKRRTYLRARAGFGIKRQVSSVFLNLTVHENLWIASYRDVRKASAAAERAEQLAAWIGLAGSVDRKVADLAHGHRQLLEIAMVLATRPSVVLLDEPTAGMTAAETQQIADVIHEISQHCTVVVVEHDMEFIRSLDAPITVMHRGAVLTSGTIDQIRSDERVLNVYLGRDHAAAE